MTLNEKYLKEMEIQMYKKALKIKKYQTLEEKNECALLKAGTSWRNLIQDINSCAACSLSQTRIKSVPGLGDYNADWLFVGEAPGIMEDKSGNPIVGRVGRLFDNIMKAMHLNRAHNVFVTNVMKCRVHTSGVDRAPTDEEVNICISYLKKQISWIQPKIIVALGTTAARALLNLPKEETISNWRGKPYYYELENTKIPVVVTLDPSKLLETPKDKEKAWEDLCLALSLMPESKKSFGLITQSE